MSYRNTKIKENLINMQNFLDNIENQSLDQSDIIKTENIIQFLYLYKRVMKFTNSDIFLLKEIDTLKKRTETFLNIKQTLYLDESGKTGSMRFSKDWNFSKQPYFVLCGILIRDNAIPQLNEFIKEIRIKYKIQQEMKSTSKIIKKHKNELIEIFYKKQQELGCKLYIEVVNKRYCIATKIVDYSVCPYYDSPSALTEASFEKEKIIKKTLANYIYDTIPDELLGAYVEFFDSNIQDVEKLVGLTNKLLLSVSNPIVAKFIKETLDTLQHHEKLHIPVHNLFPIVDSYKNETSTVAVSPQIDCLNSILSKCPKVHIVHDNICDLENALKKTAKYYFSETDSNYIEFADSKKINILQLCDFWCGIINNSIQEKLNKKNNLDIVPILKKIIETRINYVGPFNEQSILFPNDTAYTKLLLEYYQDIIGEEKMD